MFPMTPPESCIQNIIRFLQSIGKNRPDRMEVIQSHGGSGKQALEVANGLEADVVTLALEYDIDSIEKAGLIEDGWVTSSRMTAHRIPQPLSFLVRKDNPKTSGTGMTLFGTT